MTEAEKLYDFIVVGSGIGGLVSAALLGMEGHSVLVLEKNHQIGGSLQVFSRDKCVFDTGNRVAFGHDIYSDIRLLNDHIQHVHIKDKNDANENVRLGTGKVNFSQVCKSLRDINYQGFFTFETVRGSDPLQTARNNRDFIMSFYEGSMAHGH